MRKLSFALCAALLLIVPLRALAQGGADQGSAPPAPYRGADPSAAGPDGPPPEAGPGPGPGPGPDAGPGPDGGPGPEGGPNPGGMGPGPGAKRFGSSGGGKAANPKQELKQQCREEARAGGARGSEMRQAMVACIAKTNPKFARRVQCRIEAREKGLKGGSSEMRSFMQSCFKSGR